MTYTGERDWSTATLRAETKAAAYRAAAAVLRGRPLPWGTPLQREASREAVRVYCDHRLERMRSRAHVD